jgi:hypothetical protein
MKGDFSQGFDISRGFGSINHYHRVLMQQGRVQLDADVNEQASILLHYIETLAADLLGPYAAAADGFLVGDGTGGDFAIQAGHFYVDGILCENDVDGSLNYSAQADAPAKLSAAGNYLVYLDVWERHVTAVEDPAIADVALGGIDTCSRGATVWQAKVDTLGPKGWSDKNWPGLVAGRQPPNRGLLEAKAADQKPSSDPCNLQPDSQYRGAENQLYRVEIHRSSPPATYKWSRDNGSVIFPITSLTGTDCVVEHLGRDERSTLQPDDWVEVIDDAISLGEPDAAAQPLLQVAATDPTTMSVQLKTAATQTYTDTPEDHARHPYLRRWDHGRGTGQQQGAAANDGALPIVEEQWLELEDGVQVYFHSAAADDPNGPQQYRDGDYWLIPARVATGDVDWPAGQALGPQGVTHHYAPIATLVVAGDLGVTATDRRRTINTLWT